MRRRRDVRHRLTLEQGQTEIPTDDGKNTQVVCHVLETALSNCDVPVLILQPMRAVARRLGYCLALHGSMARDLDILAAPWEEWAVDAEILVEALRAIVSTFNVNGFAEIDKRATRKPHGRLCWVILRHGGYIDLSVMPRLEAKPKRPDG